MLPSFFFGVIICAKILKFFGDFFQGLCEKKKDEFLRGYLHEIKMDRKSCEPWSCEGKVDVFDFVDLIFRTILNLRYELAI